MLLLFFFLTSILNSLCIVCPPTLCATAPVGAATMMLLLSWKIFLIQATIVFIRTLLPVPVLLIILSFRYSQTTVLFSLY
jgi:hypothetical protein